MWRSSSYLLRTRLTLRGVYTSADMASRTPSPSTTSEGLVKKRKESSPLTEPTAASVTLVFRKVINLAEQTKNLAMKMSPIEKGQGPSFQSLTGRLWNAIMEYKDLRYELDIASRAHEAAPAREVTTVDTATDTDLTPHWWAASTDDVKDVPLADLGRQPPRTKLPGGRSPAPRVPGKIRKTYASAAAKPASVVSSDDDADSDVAFTEVRRKRPRTVSTIPTVRPPVNVKSSKPPAVLIKVLEGESFEGTLRTVQKAVDPGALGVNVKRISKTLNGHLLIEMSGGPKAASEAAALRRAVLEKAGGLENKVTQLGTAIEVEIIDLDPCAQKEDIQAALETAMETYGTDDAKVLKDQVAITGLWQVRSGTQIATATLPRAAAQLTTLRVGWTVAKVRPRRPEPLRCYRCHGFGHSTAECAGPDLTGKCRKCGGDGHLEKSCADAGKCVACDRLGQQYLPHRTGSGGCLARRRSEMNGGDGPTILR